MSLGSIIGSVLGVGGPSGAEDKYGQLAELYKNIDLPELQDKKYQDYVSAGQLDPSIAGTAVQGNSNLGDVSTDPRLRQAQLGALSSLQNVASQGGLNFSDKARLADILDQTNTQERGSREAILQNAQQRGIGGSGISLASQMSNEQGSAGRRNLEGLNVASDAESRALQAMQSAGNLGGSIRSQDYGEASKAAEANDAIARFNAQNSQSQMNNAANARNQAAQLNQTNAQNISNSNTTNANNAYDYNNGGKQQQTFNDQIQKANGQGGAYTGMAQTLDDEKKRKDAFTGSLLGTAGTIGAGYLAGR